MKWKVTSRERHAAHPSASVYWVHNCRSRTWEGFSHTFIVDSVTLGFVNVVHLRHDGSGWGCPGIGGRTRGSARVSTPDLRGGSSSISLIPRGCGMDNQRLSAWCCTAVGPAYGDPYLALLRARLLSPSGIYMGASASLKRDGPNGCGGDAPDTFGSPLVSSG